MTQLIESLRKCKVEGDTLYLPPISDGALPNYPEVRKALLNAGSKYKRNTFVFPSDAQPFIDRLCSGESINIKKEFQFFPTPTDIADWLVGFANIKAEHRILEPSAGQGALIDAIVRQFPEMMVECFEIMPENAAILEKHNSAIVIGHDFLEPYIDEKEGFDRIIANPPFSKNQDIDHIKKMYEFLRLNGQLVSVASNHWRISCNKKETAFREWLGELNATLYEIEGGKFKEAGTMIGCCIIVIDK